MLHLRVRFFSKIVLCVEVSCTNSPNWFVHSYLVRLDGIIRCINFVLIWNGVSMSILHRHTVASTDHALIYVLSCRTLSLKYILVNLSLTRYYVKIFICSGVVSPIARNAKNLSITSIIYFCLSNFFLRLLFVKVSWTIVWQSLMIFLDQDRLQRLLLLVEQKFLIIPSSTSWNRS